MNKLVVALLLWCMSSLAVAQRSVDFVIPFAQGGTADRLAVMLLPWLKAELAPQGLVPVLSYRPGAGSAVAVSSVARADRLQILLAPNAVVTAGIVNPGAVNYSLAQDLIPVAYLGHIPMLMMVNIQSPIKHWRQLQKWCASNPVTYGSAGTGSATHIATALVLNFLNCRSTHVPYKGVGPAMADLLGQHIDIVVDFVTSAKPHIDNHTVRAILSVDRNRYNSVPGLADLGYRDFDFYNWFVIAVNTGGSSQDQQTVKQAIDRMIRDPDLRKQLQELGLLGTGTAMAPDFFVLQEHKFRKILSATNVIQ